MDIESSFTAGTLKWSQRLQILLQAHQVILQNEIDPKSFTGHIVLIDVLSPNETASDCESMTGAIHEVCITILSSAVGIGRGEVCRVDLEESIGNIGPPMLIPPVLNRRVASIGRLGLEGASGRETRVEVQAASVVEIASDALTIH